MPFDAEEREWPCKHCHDEDGAPCFPWYGRAPDAGCLTMGIPPEPVDPYLFRRDPEVPEMGIYYRCPECGTNYDDEETHDAER